MNDEITRRIELAIQALQECELGQDPIYIYGQVFYARNLLNKALLQLDKEPSMIPVAVTGCSRLRMMALVSTIEYVGQGDQVLESGYRRGEGAR